METINDNWKYNIENWWCPSLVSFSSINKMLLKLSLDKLINITELMIFPHNDIVIMKKIIN